MNGCGIRSGETQRNETHSTMNNDKNLSSVAQDILLSGRTQLCMALPYMSGELCALVPMPGEDRTVSAATDGEAVYYSSSFLAAGFLKSERFSPRLNMHMTLHCLFRHLAKRRGRDPVLWDLACDAAVESVIDSLPYPCLMDVLQRLCNLPKFQHIEATASRADGYKVTDHNPYKAHPKDGPATFSKYDAQGPLVVRVFSFSFAKGIPEDESGNGGGYVFDCRSTHNPGRYEPYKKLTGLDEPVIRFLEDDGEILTFLDSVYKLADAHVRRYIQRGFTSLMFCFGCTGGQHRSVYSAQHLAEHIHQKFGIEVRIIHREQGITQTLQ